MKVTRDISVFQFQGLINSGLSISHIYFLELIDDGKIVKTIEGHEYYLSELQCLGCLDYKFEITIRGKNLLKDVYSKDKVKRLPNKKKEYDPRFLNWWNTFPSGDSTGDFIGIRTLRVKKDWCHDKYLELLNTYDHRLLIDVLQYEVDAREDQSKIRGENQMTYMRSTAPYLNDIENIEKYIPLVKKGPYKPRAEQKTQQKKDNSTVAI